MAFKRSLFLAHVSDGKSIRASAEFAGLELRTARRWIAEDDDFKSEYKSAFLAGTEKAEDILYERATRPDRPSDLCLLALLRARKPAVYRESHRTEVTINTAPSFADKFGDFMQRLQEASDFATKKEEAIGRLAGDTGDRIDRSKLIKIQTDEPN